jgi:glycosyltransferase involved in cell wall biosynthesis
LSGHRPKLYFVACCFPPFGRGNSLTNACVANYLAESFDVQVLCMERSEGLLLSYQEDQSLVSGLDSRLQVHRIRAGSWWGLNEILYAAGVLPCYYLNWVLSAWRKRATWSEAGVIMAVYPVFSDLVLGYALKRSSGKPLIVDFRDDFSGVMTRGWRRFLRGAYQKLEGLILRDADAITVTTEFLAEDLVARHALDPQKVQVVYNIVPVAERRPQQKTGVADRLKVIYAGAMSQVQRPEILLKAYARLRSEQPELGARIGVDFYGPESPYFKLQIRKHLVEGADFHGFCDRDEIARQLAQTDIGFFSLADATYAYATPTKLFEYIEFGIPIVAVLPQGAARDLVERNEIGLVADPGDVEALARCLRELCSSTELRERFRTNMARIRSQFSADEQAKKWRDIVCNLSGVDRAVCTEAAAEPERIA